jgi:hypothetical protein
MYAFMKSDPPKRGTQPRPSSVSAPARSWARPWLRWVAGGAGAAYIVALWLEAVGAHWVDRVLPSPIRLFVQVAALFPNALPEAIEWRARGWRCDLERYEELDVRPFFPIRRDDKENRFDRAMFFHHRQGRVLEALDAYLTTAQNLLHPDARIGGVMLLSLRVPIPPPGRPGPRHERLSIASYPPSVSRQYWYTTGVDARRQRCAESP